MPISSITPNEERPSNEWDYSDHPIHYAREDRLNRLPFAKQVAKLIDFDYPGKQIIGIYGAWGEGKTSVLNLALAEYLSIAEKSHNTPIVVEFCPWEYSAQTNLTRALFSTIAKKVYDSPLSLETRKGIAKGLVIISNIASGFASITNPEMTPAIEVAREGVDAFAKWLEKEPSFDNEKKALKDNLLTCSCPIVIVIDDIDRLLYPEIRGLIRTIKANGDLPNLTWIILCDRKIVARAIAMDMDSDDDNSGHRFLDKIIPIGLDLPKVPTNVLFDEFLRLIGKMPEQYVNDARGDLRDDPMESVRSVCVNIRNVKRLANAVIMALQLHQEYQENNTCPSIHFGDFINLEAWRIFEPDFYHAIYENKEVLMGEVCKVTKDWFNTLVNNSVSEHRRETALQFILTRFGWSGINASSNSNAQQDLVRRRDTPILRYRLAHSKYFDGYFSYRHSADEISRSEEEQFLRASNPCEKTQILLLLDKKGKLPSLLDVLENSPVFTSEREGVSYLQSLWSVAERINSNDDEWRTPILDYSRQTRIMRCSLFFIQRNFKDSLSRLNVFQTILNQDEFIISQPLYFIAMDLMHYEHNSSSSPLLEREHVEVVKETCLERLSKFHAHGILSSHPNSFNIRKYWRISVGDEAFFKATAADFYKYPDAYDNLICFMTITESEDGRFYTINLDELEKQCDVSKYLVFLQSNPCTQPEIKELVKCLEFAVDSKRSGKPYGEEMQKKLILEFRSSTHGA